MTQFYSLEVSKISQLTPSSVAISFRLPENLNGDFDFKAGQYITIRHLKDGEEIRRAYSLCSAPGKNEMTIGVKKVSDGTFSVFANEHLREGDFLEVMPPEGRFVFDADISPQNIMAFAAGSGITPIMSIIQKALDENPGNRVVLVYGNQSREETMFYEQLSELLQNYADRFIVHFLYSRSQGEDGMFGRIDNSIVNLMVRNKHKDFKADRYYVCGPLQMIEAVQESLADNGVASDHILHELFTEPEVKDTLAASLKGMTKMEVTLDESVHTFEMDQKAIVLDAVLDARIDAPYSCQGGVCSTCIARITEGSAKMVKNQILTDSELEQGYILTCQAHPTSQVLKIDYDDV